MVILCSSFFANYATFNVDLVSLRLTCWSPWRRRMLTSYNFAVPRNNLNLHCRWARWDLESPSRDHRCFYYWSFAIAQPQWLRYLSAASASDPHQLVRILLAKNLTPTAQYKPVFFQVRYQEWLDALQCLWAVFSSCQYNRQWTFIY